MVAHSVDLNHILTEQALQKVKVQFRMRYRLRYPAEGFAAYSLEPRCFREFE